MKREPYPCARCRRMEDSCNYENCRRFRTWFQLEWTYIRRLFREVERDEIIRKKGG